jgi:hypothetical protein
MKIYVDGQKIDFEAGNEKTLFDVATDVQNWANASHRFIRSIRAAGADYHQVDESMKTVPVEKVDDVHFETMTAEALAAEALADVTLFFGKLKNRASLKLPQAPDIVEALHWCYNVVSKARVVLRLDYNEPAEGTTMNKELIRLNALIEALRVKLEAPTTDTATVVRLVTEELDLDLWLKLLAGLQQKAAAASPAKAADREEALRKLSAGLMEIPELRRKIESISTLLHTGGDATAMDKLTTLSTTLTAVIQGLQAADPFLAEGLSGVRLKQGTSIADELVKLTTVFKQIVEAFDSKDIVLLCDLLEYELIPGLAVLEDVLNILIARVGTNYS